MSRDIKTQGSDRDRGAKWQCKLVMESIVGTKASSILRTEQVVVRIVARIDAYARWVPGLGASAQGTLGQLDTVITLTISFLVFTFGSLLVAIQVAGGPLTPRIIATTLLSDNVIRFTVRLHRRDTLSFLIASHIHK